MVFIKLFFGIIFFLLGWIFLYKSNIVLTVNRLARDIVFNDRRVLLERKKLAIVFFCFSFIALYMGFTSLTLSIVKTDKNAWTMQSDQYLMYMAMQDYCTERYESALAKYFKVLRADPDNVEALKRIAYTYTAMGEKKKARAIWQQLLRLAPEDHEIRLNLAAPKKTGT